MVLTRSINPVLRAVGVIGVVAGLVTAVTFAALTSSATLTANTLTSASAGLFVANGDVDATSNTDEGFAINGLVPGGDKSQPYLFNLKNTGDTPLDVTVYATNSAVTGVLNNDKVHFCFTQIDDGLNEGVDEELCYTRTQMLNNFNALPSNPLTDNGDNILYQMTVQMDEDAVNGDGVQIAPFDLVFTGTSEPSGAQTDNQ